MGSLIFFNKKLMLPLYTLQIMDELNENIKLSHPNKRVNYSELCVGSDSRMTMYIVSTQFP